MIGILGGMGPLATADFFRKVIQESSALREEDHVPLLIQSDPRVPSRPAALLAGGVSPLPALLAGRDRLIAAGATALAMPCNTAHYWYPQLAARCPVPFLNIVESTCNALEVLVPSGAKVGLLATRATIAAKLYEPELQRRGYVTLLPSDLTLDGVVLPAIDLVKAGRPLDAAPQLYAALEAMAERGAEIVILGCTELPLAMESLPSVPLPCIDTTVELARACVWHWQRVSAS